ncbi:MAG: ABC-2 transporter permease, partial [Gammaproteobacteria bacterium]
MIFTIAGKEMKTLFLSPLAWAILAVVQVILAYFFLVYLEYYEQILPQLTTLPNAPGVTNMVVVPLFATVAVVLLLVVPLLTMRLVSEERRNQTLPLLLSAPVSVTEIIIGKYAGIMGFLLVMLGLVTLMPLSLYGIGTIDAGMLLASLLALILLLGSFASLG